MKTEIRVILEVSDDFDEQNQDKSGKPYQNLSCERVRVSP
jgi:hypothetical protein